MCWSRKARAWRMLSVRLARAKWLRDELLNGEMFYTLRQAQIVIESWRRHSNAVRPHA